MPDSRREEGQQQDLRAAAPPPPTHLVSAGLLSLPALPYLLMLLGDLLRIPLPTVFQYLICVLPLVMVACAMISLLLLRKSKFYWLGVASNGLVCLLLIVIAAIGSQRRG